RERLQLASRFRQALQHVLQFPLETGEEGVDDRGHKDEENRVQEEDRQRPGDLLSLEETDDGAAQVSDGKSEVKGREDAPHPHEKKAGQQRAPSEQPYFEPPRHKREAFALPAPEGSYGLIDYGLAGPGHGPDRALD